MAFKATSGREIVMYIRVQRNPVKRPRRYYGPNCKGPLIFLFENPVNPTNPLIRPNVHGPQTARNK